MSFYVLTFLMFPLEEINFKKIVTFTFIMKEAVLKYLKNYYIMGASFFVVWMLFFDKNDFITQFKLKSQLYDMRAQRDFYKEKTGVVEQERKELLEDDALLEKFAREKYWMKKETEDVYIIEETKRK